MSSSFSSRPGKHGLPGKPGRSEPPAQPPGSPDPTAQYGDSGSDYMVGAAYVTEQDQGGAALAMSAWPAFLAAGIGCLAAGVLLLVWPNATLVVGAILIGASLVVAGLLRLIHGFTASDESGGRRAASIVIGLLAIALGLYFIRHYHVTIAVLAIVVGLFWVINGIAEIGAGLFGGAAGGRFLTVIAGALSLFAGLILLFWPTISLTILVAVIGIWLIVYGLLMAVMAFSLRRSGSQRTRQGRLAAP